MECKLSVIVASYNYERFIEKTLNSLVSQSRKTFEIVVVDDGSKDNSVNIIKEFVFNYKNIKFLQHEHHKNKGLAETVLLALRNASGEYIAFCESDDFWDRNHVDELLRCIDEHPGVELIFNRIKCVNNSSREIYNDYVNNSNKFLYKKNGCNIFDDIFSLNLMPTFSASCIKKDVLKQCDFNSPIRPYLDFWIWRQLCFIKNIYFANNAITIWNKHDDSYDMTHTVVNLSNFIYLSNKLIINKYGKLYKNDIETEPDIDKRMQLQYELLKKIRLEM